MAKKGEPTGFSAKELREYALFMQRVDKGGALDGRYNLSPKEQSKYEDYQDRDDTSGGYSFHNKVRTGNYEVGKDDLFNYSVKNDGREPLSADEAAIASVVDPARVAFNKEEDNLIYNEGAEPRVDPEALVNNLYPTPASSSVPQRLVRNMYGETPEPTVRPERISRALYGDTPIVPTRAEKNANRQFVDTPVESAFNRGPVKRGNLFGFPEGASKDNSIMGPIMKSMFPAGTPEGEQVRQELRDDAQFDNYDFSNAFLPESLGGTQNFNVSRDGTPAPIDGGSGRVLNPDGSGATPSLASYLQGQVGDADTMTPGDVAPEEIAAYMEASKNTASLPKERDITDIIGVPSFGGGNWKKGKTEKVADPAISDSSFSLGGTIDPVTGKVTAGKTFGDVLPDFELSDKPKKGKKKSTKKSVNTPTVQISAPRQPVVVPQPVVAAPVKSAFDNMSQHQKNLAMLSPDFVKDDEYGYTY